MMIGSFGKYDDVYTGRLHTLGIDAMVTIAPAPPSDEKNAPDWLAMLGDETSCDEVGAGWNRVDAETGDIISVRIDSPALAEPLRANLHCDVLVSGLHPLFWARPDAPWRVGP
jgi:uncharacterized protein (DUF736 family)